MATSHHSCYRYCRVCRSRTLHTGYPGWFCDYCLFYEPPPKLWPARVLVALFILLVLAYLAS